MTSAAIILAAGSSSRMGQSKQLLDIKGKKLLIRTIDSVLQAGISEVTVVLGSEEPVHRKILKGLPVDIVHNPDWEKGMGSSLKAGLQYLISKNPSFETIVVLVCDQPLLSKENISSLLNKYSDIRRPIIASRYSGMPGVPALFDKSYFKKLATLPDDQGAKKIILQNPADVYEIDFPGGEVDLDTMEDYRAFQGEV